MGVRPTYRLSERIVHLCTIPLFGQHTLYSLKVLLKSLFRGRNVRATSTAQATLSRTRRIVASSLFAAAGVLSLLVLASWCLGRWRAAAMGRDYIPVSPSTAWLFFLLSVCVLVNLFRASGRLAGGLRLVVVLTVAGVSLLILAQDMFHFQVPVERWLAPEGMRVGLIPVGRMSPLTAVTFLLVASALLLQWPPLGASRGCRRTASLLVLAVLSIALVVLMGYAAGAPLLYSGQTIPMALLTAILFLQVGLGVLLTARTDTWPLSLFARLPRASLAGLPPRIAVGPLLVLICLTAALVTTGVIYARHQIAVSRHMVQNEVAAVADLKSREISEWAGGLLGHARYLQRTYSSSKSIREFLANPAAVDAKNHVRILIASARDSLGFARVVLFDHAGRIRMAAPASEERDPPGTPSLVTRTLLTGRIQGTDLSRCSASPERVCMEIGVPLASEASEGDPLAGPVGALLLEIDPADFLFPVVRSWPTPSLTAETLLARREGDNVVFLNQVRSSGAPPLTLRLPVDPAAGLPEGMAVMGVEGGAEGVDYRGVPVLAALRAVPGTPWFIVAKVDQSEVYAPVRERFLSMGLILVFLSFGALLGLTQLLSRRDNLWLRKQLATEQERRVLAQWNILLRKEANDSILLTDENWRILEANDRALQTYGYALAEMRSMRMPDLRAPQARAEFAGEANVIMSRDGTILEAVHRRKDDSTFPVESTIRGIEIDGRKFYQSIIRDITERKQAEEALRQSEAKFRAIVETTPDMVWEVTADCTFTYASPQFEEGLGYSPAGLIGRRFSDLLMPDAVDSFARQFEWAVTCGSAHTTQEVVARHGKRGQPVYLEITAVPVLSGSGTAVGFRGFARDITERVEARRALAEYQEGLRSMAAELALGEERERRRIAVGLHDQIGQTLALVCLRMEQMADRAESESLRKQWREMLATMHSALDATHSLTFELSPPVLYQLGLVPAVKWLQRNLHKQSGITFTVETSGEVESLDEDVKILLFQTIRELLVNAVKHSKARTCHTDLSSDGQRILVTVEDDGVGFEPISAQRRRAGRGSFGLFSIAERLRTLGGSMKIKSNMNQGCLVAVEIPVKQGAEVKEDAR